MRKHVSLAILSLTATLIASQMVAELFLLF